MSLEALSRGAASATLIDNDQNAKRSILKNIQSFEIENETTFLFGNVFSLLKRLAEKGKEYDIIYADPPYESGYGEKLVLFLDHNPLLKKGGLLLLEEGIEIDINPETLILKDCRRYGRTKLHRYIRY